MEDGELVMGVFSNYKRKQRIGSQGEFTKWSGDLCERGGNAAVAKW